MGLMAEFPLAGEAERNGLAKSDEIGDVGAGELAFRPTRVNGRLEQFVPSPTSSDVG